jgi:hypothetical protein
MKKAQMKKWGKWVSQWKMKNGWALNILMATIKNTKFIKVDDLIQKKD